MTEFIDLSDSQIKEYQRCPRRWALNRLLKVPNNEDKDNLTFGKIVHAGLEVLHGQPLPHALQAAGKERERSWEKDREQITDDKFKLALALIEGYNSFFYPRFAAEWETVRREEWFEFFSSPSTKIRGFKDNTSIHRVTQRKAIFDYKTSSYLGGGDLGEEIASNVQLALYSAAYFAKRKEWPDEVGLIFLTKPRSKDAKDCIDRAKSDPSLYSIRSTPVNETFRAFAHEVVASTTAYGLQMLQIRQIVAAQGKAGLAYAPCNFGGCHAYNRTCGYFDACTRNKLPGG